MRTEDFEKLIASVKQAGQIRRGRRKPSRALELRPTDVRAIRQKFGRSQAEFALTTTRRAHEKRGQFSCPDARAESAPGLRPVRPGVALAKANGLAEALP